MSVAEQVTVLETEMATSKAAAQAAAEAAAHDIACLSTALMRTEARCNELQTAHGEVRHHVMQRCELRGFESSTYHMSF